jgi:hypothetical protein
MEPVTPRVDNLQNELRRELDPQGFLEEEVFQSLVEAALNRRRSQHSDRYTHDRAFFLALRELRALQAERSRGPRPEWPANVIVFPGRAASSLPVPA